MRLIKSIKTLRIVFITTAKKIIIFRPCLKIDFSRSYAQCPNVFHSVHLQTVNVCIVLCDFAVVFFCRGFACHHNVNVFTC